MDKFNLIEKQKATVKLFDSNGLPTVIGNIARIHFRNSFRDGGFTDSTLEKWQPRKADSLPQTTKAWRESQGRAVLVGVGSKGGGDLRRSLRVLHVTKGSVTIGSDLIYAGVHNYGLRAGRGAGFTMPKREFVGDSKQLNDKILRNINKRIMAILNG